MIDSLECQLYIQGKNVVWQTIRRLRGKRSNAINSVQDYEGIILCNENLDSLKLISDKLNLSLQQEWQRPLDD